MNKTLAQRNLELMVNDLLDHTDAIAAECARANDGPGREGR